MHDLDLIEIAPFIQYSRLGPLTLTQYTNKPIVLKKTSELHDTYKMIEKLKQRSDFNSSSERRESPLYCPLSQATKQSDMIILLFPMECLYVGLL